MPTLDRRQFLKLAAALGATLAWGCSTVQPSTTGWRERRDLFPQGVASGDPDDNSVLLWTRRPYDDGRERATLLVEVAEDPGFTRVIATTAAPVLAAADWTCRVLVGDLRPAGEYWYRFVDEEGHGSRIGRTLTAPAADDPRPARFAFVSCQSLPEGAMNAYRKMIFEDERAVADERLGFVLHLGDFIYEVVQSPEQVVNGKRYDRVITFPVKFPQGRPVAGNRFMAPVSLADYRALRWGRHIDLLITDQRSFRGPDPSNRDELGPLFEGVSFPFFPEALARHIDGGRDVDGGPPATLAFGDRTIPNFRASEPAQTMLGAKQKAWFLQRLRGATATWKIWGTSLGTPDWRIDPQHMPASMGEWTDGHAILASGDWGGTYVERAEIFDAVRDAGLTGFAIVAGDRHSFWAGLAAKALPPAAFEPVGVTFVGGSITSPGMQEAWEHGRKDNPLRPLFIADRADGTMAPTMNLLLNHGVRSALEYARGGDLAAAHAAADPDTSPHLSFVDMGGHGYATVRVDATTLATDFVCIPRPLARAPGADGGPVRYRVRHEVALWAPGEAPRMTQTVLEGDAGLSL